ncbi:MAG: SAM-dependent methyltransferase [Actinobacteria bacterium]|nr:SAM-dependent methyltransferase [Actinomycetota bacterium]
MPRYAVLVHPSTNRVYADASVQLMRAELAVLNRSVLGGRLADVGQCTLGGVPYLTFDAAELDEAAIGSLSTLSALYALFEVSGELLRPVPVRPLARFDSDLLSILRYTGKTNEHFTRLLLNVTVLASAAAPEMTTRRLRVLDPLCGRGTTLNQALMYGYHAAGIDLDGKDIDAYAAFLRSWLTGKRLKHRTESGPVRRHGKTLGRRFHAVIGETKQQYQAGDTVEVTAVHADTRSAGDFFRPGTFDVVVTDAPYGVQHGSRTGRLARGPLELLDGALPAWGRLLVPGGALGISWNTLVAPRVEVVGLLDRHGFEVVDFGPEVDFTHRVAQAVVRDLVVARQIGGGPPVTAGRDPG